MTDKPCTVHFVPDDLYHVYNQGNNQEKIFLCDDDYLVFLRLVKRLIKPNAEIIAYCLMPNHFHFILFADERILNEIRQGSLVPDPLTNGFRKLLSGYARIFNEKNNRTGSLFRAKTKAKSISENLLNLSVMQSTDYYSKCFNYIHENPLRAGLVNDLKNWKYSSWLDYAGIRAGNLCNRKLAKEFDLV